MIEVKKDNLSNVLRFLGIGLSIVGLILCGPLWRLQHIRIENTSNAIRTGLSIHLLQYFYSRGFGQGSYASKVTDFEPLSPKTDYSGPIDWRVITMQHSPVDGYIIASMKTTPKTSNSEPAYFFVIVPQVQRGLFRAGNDCFYFDQTGEIKHSGSPTIMPDANSPLLQQ